MPGEHRITAGRAGSNDMSQTPASTTASGTPSASPQSDCNRCATEPTGPARLVGSNAASASTCASSRAQAVQSSPGCRETRLSARMEGETPSLRGLRFSRGRPSCPATHPRPPSLGPTAPCPPRRRDARPGWRASRPPVRPKDADDRAPSPSRTHQMRVGPLRSTAGRSASKASHQTAMSMQPSLPTRSGTETSSGQRRAAARRSASRVCHAAGACP